MSADRSPLRENRSYYRIFGLTIASDLPLPEANISASPSEADVRIYLGGVPASLPGGRKLASWIEVQDGVCLLRFEGLGRFLVEAGCRIIVEKDERASYDDLRGFLFGSAFGALVHQRGLVPLHVSAVATPDRAVAFTGESGAGKSTLAAVLNQDLDLPIICDDVAVLRRSQDGFHLESGVNTVKLWDDALQALNRSREGLRRDLTRHDKFHAIQSERFSRGSPVLKRLVRLEWGDEPKLERATGRRAYQIALGAIYRPEFAGLFSNRANVASVCMELAARVEVFVLERPKDHAARAATMELLSAALAIEA